MTQFVQGDSILDLPILLGFAGRFLFAPVTERWVEALHASSKKWLATAPNAGAVHLAFFSVQAFLRDYLQSSPGSLTRLSALCRRVRNPLAACTAMGFQFHPVVNGYVRACGKRLALRKFAKHFTHVLYHVDPFTMY
eukprot:6818202-Lingulodinium_polyedra.AAC.1